MRKNTLFSSLIQGKGRSEEEGKMKVKMPAKKVVLITALITLTSVFSNKAKAQAAEPPCDSIGGLSLGQPQSMVIKKYGKPERIVKIKDEPAFACPINYDWHYKSLGLIVNICEGYVTSITITPTSKLRTSKNIGVGSTAEEVIAIYGGELYEVDPSYEKWYGADSEIIIHGDGSCGLAYFFYLKKGKVISIVWTNYA